MGSNNFFDENLTALPSVAVPVGSYVLLVIYFALPNVEALPFAHRPCSLLTHSDTDTNIASTGHMVQEAMPALAGALRTMD